MKYYLRNGFKLFKDQKKNDPRWEFLTYIDSRYNDKKLTIVFASTKKEMVYRTHELIFRGKKFKHIFKEAIMLFKSNPEFEHLCGERE